MSTTKTFRDVKISRRASLLLGSALDVGQLRLRGSPAVRLALRAFLRHGEGASLLLGSALDTGQLRLRVSPCGTPRLACFFFATAFLRGEAPLEYFRFYFYCARVYASTREQGKAVAAMQNQYRKNH